MNETFSKPVSGDSARLNERKTFVTPSVVHTLSEYESIKGVRSHYCYLIIPNSKFIWYRRNTCTPYVKCKALYFLNCINKRCGKWKIGLFKKEMKLLFNIVRSKIPICKKPITRKTGFFFVNKFRYRAAPF